MRCLTAVEFCSFPIQLLQPLTYMQVTLQLAAIPDLPHLVSMMSELQKDDPWSIPFARAAVENAVGQLLRDTSLGRVWLIEADKQVAGYIVMCFDYSLEYGGRGAWVDEFFVRPSHRGRGIGSQVLDLFLEQAKAVGVTTVHLEVNHDNPAIELYRRKGFEDHHRYLMTKWITNKPPVS